MASIRDNPDQPPYRDGPISVSSGTRSTRRHFAITGASALALVLFSRMKAKEPVSPEEPPKKRRGRRAMAIDLNRCIGCNACAVACKAEHGVRLGGFRSWVSEEEVGTYPAVTREFLPRLCNHCKNPPCLKVCPTGATSKRGDGIVMVDQSRCIGCRHCMEACPYNARYFNSQHDPKDEQKRFKARTHGTVDKCDFCSRRVDAGDEPACVSTCPGSARIFGDLEDLGSRVSQIVKASASATLLEDLGTEPSVFYIGRRSIVSRPG
jgi:molybdopterin-containing oxidoreductase family iron-sulfur binding subunit